MSEGYPDYSPEASGTGPESSTYEQHPPYGGTDDDARAVGHTALSGTVEQPND